MTEKKILCPECKNDMFVLKIGEDETFKSLNIVCSKCRKECTFGSGVAVGLVVDVLRGDIK